MKIHIITLFPEMFEGVFNTSILKRAQEKGLVTVNMVNLRDFGLGKHKTVDDMPYGGGAGMVLRVDVLVSAIRHVKKESPNTQVFLMDPKGKPFSQEEAETFSDIESITLICGHYEGTDARITHYIDGEISMGDFVLTGGEIPAMAIVDAVVRLLPGVLGHDESSQHESFTKVDDKRTLEHDHYTRPEVFEDHKVPEVLLSGNHKHIQTERHTSSEKNTKEKRPDLL